MCRCVYCTPPPASVPAGVHSLPLVLKAQTPPTLPWLPPRCDFGERKTSKSLSTGAAGPWRCPWHKCQWRGFVGLLWAAGVRPGGSLGVSPPSAHFPAMNSPRSYKSLRPRPPSRSCCLCSRLTSHQSPTLCSPSLSGRVGTSNFAEHSKRKPQE